LGALATLALALAGLAAGSTAALATEAAPATCFFAPEAVLAYVGYE